MPPPITGAISRLCLTCLLLFSSASTAGDWPQILGISRDGHAMGEKLAANWNNAQPQQIWSHKVGEGYAGPAIAGGRVYIFHREAANETLTCLSAMDGSENWKTSWRAMYGGGIDSDKGPRCVTHVHQDRVYGFSAAGDLHCADAIDGKKVWSRRLGKDYKAKDGYFGFFINRVKFIYIRLDKLHFYSFVSAISVDSFSNQSTSLCC